MKRAWILGGMVWVVAGCAGSGPRGVAQEDEPKKVCFQSDRARDIEVQGPRLVMVRESPNRSYRLTLAANCPGLEAAETVGFSNGPAMPIGVSRDGRTLYGEPQNPTGRVCAQGFDRVVPYPVFHQFDRPLPGCRIERIERINETTGEHRG